MPGTIMNRRPPPSGLIALVLAAIGLLATAISGFALVPRIKLVEVVTLVASAMGAGAALAVAIMDYRNKRR